MREVKEQVHKNIFGRTIIIISILWFYICHNLYRRKFKFSFFPLQRLTYEFYIIISNKRNCFRKNIKAGKYISWTEYYSFLWIYAQECDCWVIWQLYFSFLRNLHSVHHSGYYQFSLPHTLQHLLFVDFLMTAILTDVRLPHCSFDLHFSNNQ